MLRNIARPFARVATRSASVPVKPNTPQHLKRPAAAMMNDHIFDALRSPNCIFSESKRNPNLKKTGNDPTQASAAHESHSSAFDGYDEEPHPGMIARIRKTAEQGNNMGKSKTWKIDLDNYEESSFLGPSGEPLPIVTAHMKFSTIEDAIAFCEENNWAYELDLINQDKY